MEVTPDEARKALADTDLFLGDAFKIERMGVIRPGIRVPKRDCPQDLVALYGRLVEEGKTWDEIDAQLGLDPQKKSWLTPRNVDFFWVGRGDCHADPSHAELIRKLYADRDGKIRKINIRFPFDDINRMIAVKLSCYTSAGLRYVGRFHGGRLMCEDMAAMSEQREKKAQVFSRKRTLKPCIPDQCDFYQEKACRMHGGFIFSIPGVPGLGVWAIYTRSAYNSMVYIRTMLQKIEGLARDYCGLSGIPGDLFHLKKIRGKVSSDGRRQYLITISSNHDADQVERILAGKYLRKNVVAPAAAARKPIVRAVRPAAVPQGVDQATGEILREGADAALGNKPAGPSDAGGQPNASAASLSQPKATAAQEPKTETTTPRKASPQPAQDNGTAPRKGGQGRNAGNGAGDYDARLISFMKNELMKHPLLAGVNKVNIVKGVEKISTEILGKSAKKTSAVEVDRLIGTIKARLGTRDATAFTQGNGSGGDAPVPKQGPGPAQDAPAVDSLSGDWPEGAAEAPGSPSTPKAAQQEASSSAPRPGPDDPFVGLSVQIAPFLRGAMKNPLFARVQGSFRQIMDSYSTRSFGKELAKLSPEEIGKFMNAVAGALARKDVDAIIGDKSQDGPQQSAQTQRANTAA
jgi:hypothetical protein